MGYVDDIEERCKGCKFHEIVNCDYDMIASYCNKANKYISQIIDCQKWYGK